MRKILLTAKAIVLVSMLNSCATDEYAEVEATNELVNENVETADLVTKSPCTISLLDIKPNTAFTVDCTIDLQGKSVQLANDVTLNYEGGSITNGTITFNGGQIDGELLNHSLDVKGNVSLLNETFEFEAEKWTIKQGAVSAQEALHNRLQLEEIIKTVKRLGATTFTVEELDAYFDVTTNTHPSNPNFYYWEEAINIPSDFSFIMGQDTHLRVYPNNSDKYALMAINESENAVVKGGNLYGDRDEHDYSTGRSHEWGHVFLVRGAKHAIVDGVTLKYGSGDGMKIESQKFTFQSNYNPTDYVTVTNCVFDSNRRNNLSITDGYNIIIENSTFLRAGIDTEGSQGIAPKFQIDVEAHRKVDSNGNLIEYEKVDGVIIRNNVERDGAAGGFLIYTGENVTMDSNYVESGIAYNYAINATISNNTLQAPVAGEGVAIKAGSGDSERIFGNKVHGNKITGFATGILVYSQDHVVSNNEITNCTTGIAGKNMKNVSFIENRIESSLADGRGIYLHSTTADNVLFERNYINTKNNPLRLQRLNMSSNDSEKWITFRENKILSPNYKAEYSYANNINFLSNEIITGNDVRNCKNLNFNGNLVDGSQTGKHTFEFRGECSGILVHYNDLIAPKGWWATHEHDSLSDGAVHEKSNKFSYR